MTLDQLKTFYLVAKTGSFTGAAIELNVDQSSISRKIIAMETRLKTKLFLRSSRGLIITPEGKILLKEAKNIIERLDGLKTLLSQVNSGEKGCLVIHTYVGFFDFFIRPYLSDFLIRFPDITFKIEKDDTDSMNFESSDMVIGVTPYLYQADNVIRKPVLRAHLNLYASEEYLEKYGVPEIPEDLDRHKLIAYGPKNSISSLMNWHLTTGAIQPRSPIVEINCPDTRLLLAESGHGIATIPAEIPTLSRNNLKQVLPKIESPFLDFFFTYSTVHKEAVPIKKFLEFFTSITDGFKVHKI